MAQTHGQDRLAERSAKLRAKAEELGVERVRSRTSAYVYGNMLVLAAVVQNTEGTIPAAGP